MLAGAPADAGAPVSAPTRRSVARARIGERWNWLAALLADVIAVALILGPLPPWAVLPALRASWADSLAASAYYGALFLVVFVFLTRCLHAASARTASSLRFEPVRIGFSADDRSTTTPHVQFGYTSSTEREAPPIRSEDMALGEREPLQFRPTSAWLRSRVGWRVGDACILMAAFLAPIAAVGGQIVFGISLAVIAMRAMWTAARVTGMVGGCAFVDPERLVIQGWCRSREWEWAGLRIAFAYPLSRAFNRVFVEPPNGPPIGLCLHADAAMHLAARAGCHGAATNDG